MLTSYYFEKVRRQNIRKFEPVKAFLTRMGLGIDADVEFFVVAFSNGQVVATGGLAGNTLKSIAVDESLQGQGVSTSLISELVKSAYDLGRFNLFIYTKPENYKLFKEAGFHLLASVKNRVVLLENSKSRLNDYCARLRRLKQFGQRVGSIVMNANPFTFGHRHLVEKAASECDWVHLFVVKEDRSFFSYQDRLLMIQQGLKDLKNVIIHEGSDYIISRATFPSYFLKDEGVINYCHTAMDLQIFRTHIAPALGITHRYVGTEPLCKVTNFYNQQMQQWLTTPTLESDPITLIEIPRMECDKEPVSASLVRNLLFDNQWSMIEKLVPRTTYLHLKRLFDVETSPYQVKRRAMSVTERQQAQPA
ncbi:[citrate (pro-3S)-lyase] ligase [Vibrio panuliri]|uniref:[Citrate [pro-3S]-lyase] ligase n=1 Tax=Vibrio panuliri TaxID=1381081 RepID=A0A1Q9HAU9_9VIBR|nr:[citrate (pro-3S)-lyase] ligase [Vibrio panuliri]OLQ86300.1 [citrate (pro-3S)-lyase] ligase [Vibrio panuliri]